MSMWETRAGRRYAPGDAGKRGQGRSRRHLPDVRGAPGPGKIGRGAACVEEEWATIRTQMGEEWPEAPLWGGQLMGRTEGSSRPSAHDGRVARHDQGGRAGRRGEELDAVDARRRLGRAGAVGVRAARGDHRHEVPKVPGDADRPNSTYKRRPGRPGTPQDKRRRRPWRVETHSHRYRSCHLPGNLAGKQLACR